MRKSLLSASMLQGNSSEFESGELFLHIDDTFEIQQGNSSVFTADALFANVADPILIGSEESGVSHFFNGVGSVAGFVHRLLPLKLREPSPCLGSFSINAGSSQGSSIEHFALQGRNHLDSAFASVSGQGASVLYTQHADALLAPVGGTRNAQSVPTVPRFVECLTVGVDPMDLKKVAESLEEIALFRAGKAKLKTTEVIAPAVNVKTIREDLNLSQSKFAKKFGFTEAAVKNWEQGVREPEGPARILLSLIARSPDEMEKKIKDVRESAAELAQKKEAAELASRKKKKESA